VYFLDFLLSQHIYTLYGGLWRQREKERGGRLRGEANGFKTGKITTDLTRKVN
jgi:hypothetical protein